MSVASVGNGPGPASGAGIPGGMIPPELPRNRGAAPRAQFYAARQPKPRHTGAAEQAGAVLPANEEPKPQGLHAVAADLEQISLAFNKRLQFVVDHDSNEVTVKVIDRETDKVIKELPPEELQRLHSKLKETIGFLFDERV